jgi:hypothetical protein
MRTCEGANSTPARPISRLTQMIPVTWPFAVWGLDIVGPLQKAPGGYTHLLVTIDMFSKWV